MEINVTQSISSGKSWWRRCTLNIKADRSHVSTIRVFCQWGPWSPRKMVKLHKQHSSFFFHRKWRVSVRFYWHAVEICRRIAPANSQNEDITRCVVTASLVTLWSSLRSCQYIPVATFWNLFSLLPAVTTRRINPVKLLWWASPSWSSEKSITNSSVVLLLLRANWSDLTGKI